MGQSKDEKIGSLIIQDKAVTANAIEGIAVGEALGAVDDIPTQRMSPSERKDMVTRLERCINELIDEADKAHQANCYKPGTTEVNPDYITRLATNEFFFYTKEPLTLKEFEELQNKIYLRAKMISPGVQLILGTFAVQTDNNKVMSVTPHITCGQQPEFNFIVKNITSSLDVRYKIPDGKGETALLDVLDAEHKPFFMPKIKVNGVSHDFTFNNIVLCRTPDGTKFLTIIDICSDHGYGVGEKNYEALAKKAPNMCRLPISQIIVSNSISLMKGKCLVLAVMHVDPVYSAQQCKEGAAQTASSPRSLAFGKETVTIYDVESTKIQSTLMNTYAYKDSKNHLYAVEFRNYKDSYRLLSGDLLKTKILDDFKEAIKATYSLEGLAELKDKLIKSPEYTILETGQDVFTKATGIKTSSVIALEEMLTTQEAIIEANLANNLSGI